MKKNKGFTLIELLAIIVILAIIAVITVPIILNVIDNAKQGTAKDSAYGYKDAISKYYVSGMLEENSIQLNGTYNVVDGKLGEYDIPFSGTKPTSGYLIYKNNVLTNGCLTIDDYKIEFKNGEVVKTDKGACESAYLEMTYKCKRAIELHTEECTQTSTEYYCSGAGYTQTGSKGTTTITYGNTEVTQGTLTSGDAFDCDVNGNGEYEATERFYYVSDLYNTTTKQFDSNYAVLIYYNNFFDQEPNNTSSSLVAYYNYTDDDNQYGINYEGPVTAITYLPTTSTWTNITLSNPIRTIINQNGEETSGDGSYNLPTTFSYEGYAARLLTAQEINSACNITVGSKNKGELDNCNYLMENTKYSNSSLGTYGYWLETSRETGTTHIWNVSGLSIVDIGKVSNLEYSGVRPAIEVLKTDIEY